MNVKLKVLTAGVLFFTGQALVAQEVKTDSTSLEEKKIDEVVILGYSRSMNKTKNNTSTTTISASKLENRPSTSFLNSIQGNTPGVSINSQSGSPGSGAINVQIRGIGTINASSDPAYVIDGFISSSTEFRNLNPNDIESVSILKDAQATAIYGNFGANGVVVITTKSGSYNSGLKFTYDAVTSFSRFPKQKYNVASSQDHLRIQKAYGAGVGASMTDEEINSYDVDTDWEKEFFNSYGFSQQHNLGIRYGGKDFTSFTSLGYLDNEGIMKSTDFKRFTLRSNVSGRSKNRRLSYSANISLGYSKRNQFASETDSGIANNTIQNPLLGALTAPTYLEPYRFANGKEMFAAIGRSFTGYSPWILADVINGGIVNRFTQKSITANGSLTYKILDGLSVTNKTGVTYKDNVRNWARTPNGYLSLIVAASAGAEYGGWETYTESTDTVLNSITSVNYEKSFGDHTLSLGGYMDYLRGFYNSHSLTQNGLIELGWALGAGTGYAAFNTATPTLYRPTVSMGNVKAGTMAYFATLDYDFASKYGVSAMVRRDGSYRFSPGYKWDTFWSVAGRWNIDKEAFMDNSIFNMLKLRVSYGTNGNQNIIAPSNNVNSLYLGSNAVREVYDSGVGYEDITGFYTTTTNALLSWEKSSQFNAGLDFGIWRNRIEGSVDVYEKITDGLYYDVPVSAVMGTYTLKGNNGKISNRGIEANIRYNAIRKSDFKLSIFANGGYNKNKIKELPSEDLSGVLVNSLGGPVYQWQMYRYVGVDPTDGYYQFLDKDGNITKNPTASDRVLTGKSVYPKFQGGFGLDVDFKGFYLTSLFSYQVGGWSRDTMDMWLNLPAYGIDSAVSANLLNAWTPTNTNTDVAALRANATSGIMGSSDMFLRKTDYLRLKNISVGYNIRKDFLRGLPITSAKIYLMGENLVTWTGWKGYDPETALGYSIGVYPNAKTYSIGLNVEF